MEETRHPREPRFVALALAAFAALGCGHSPHEPEPPDPRVRAPAPAAVSAPEPPPRPAGDDVPPSDRWEGERRQEPLDLRVTFDPDHGFAMSDADREIYDTRCAPRALEQ